MTVRDLIAELSKHDPDAKVIGYDTYRKDGFWVREVVSDEVVDNGYSDGFTKERCLGKFFTSDVSAVSREALGSRMKVEDTPDQLSGVGFSLTQRNDIVVRVKGNTERVVKIKF